MGQLLMNRIQKLHAAFLAAIERLLTSAPGFGVSMAALSLLVFSSALTDERCVPDEACQYVRQHAFQGLRLSVGVCAAKA
jgi:hypothetical protein